MYINFCIIASLQIFSSLSRSFDSPGAIWADTKFVWSDNFIFTCIIVMYTVLTVHLQCHKKTPTLHMYMVSNVWHRKTCYSKMPNLLDICLMTGWYLRACIVMLD